jgi:galactokinase
MRAQPAGIAGFTALFGRAPEVVASAPGRVNLIGEHTDYNDGFVLPFAIAQRTSVLLAARDDGTVRLATTRAQSSAPRRPIELPLAMLRPGMPAGWAGYPAGVLWALARAGHRVRGADLLVEGGVPVGAGLSSSAALETATALAVATRWELPLSRPALAEIARSAEADYVGVPCGIMDQMAALSCTEGHVLLLDTRTLEARSLPLRPAGAGLTLLVIDTAVRHSLGDTAYPERRATCQAAAAELGVPALRDIDPAQLPSALHRLTDPVARRRVRHVVGENARVLTVADLLDTGRLAAIGPELTRSHASLRDDYEVSCAELDTAVDAAVAAGALGARMTGGGFGGCAIALVREDAVAEVTGAVVAAFAAARFAQPRVFVTVPSAGAAAVRL